MRNTNLLKYGIAILLSAGALYLAFRGQDFDSLFDIIKQANIWFILLALALQLVAHYIRAWRWQFSLRPVKPNIGIYHSFKAVVAGYGLNNIIPRAGELVRPAMIAQSESIPFASALATIVLERILDVIALGSIFAVSLYLFQDEFMKAFPEIAQNSLAALFIISAFLIFFVLILVNKTISDMLIMMMRKFLPQKIATLFVTAFGTFTKGLHGLSRDTILPILLGTVGVWLFYTLSTFASIFILPGSGIEHIGFSGAIAILALTGVAITIPTPGGLGTFHYFISRALNSFFFIPLPTAIAFATISHSSNYIVVTLLGVFYMIRAGVSIKAAKKEA